AEPLGYRLCIGLVEGCQYLAAKVETLAHLAHQMQRHDAFWLHPEVRVAIPLGYALARDLEQVAEAARHDQAETRKRTLLGEQGVGRYRRSVRHAGHLVKVEARQIGDLMHTMHESDGRIAWRAGRLGRVHRAAVFLESHHVSERAARVDSDPPTHVLAGQFAAGASSTTRPVTQPSCPSDVRTRTQSPLPGMLRRSSTSSTCCSRSAATSRPVTRPALRTAPRPPVLPLPLRSQVGAARGVPTHRRVASGGPLLAAH